MIRIDRRAEEKNQKYMKCLNAKQRCILNARQLCCDFQARAVYLKVGRVKGDECI